MADYFETGFVTREQAWHGLAIVLPEAPSIRQAIAASGLDWQIQERPLSTTWCVDGIDDNGPCRIEQRIEVPDRKALVRETDGKVLSVVSSQYVVLQNADIFGWFQPLVDDGTVTLETAGSLQDGRKVWVQARYAEDLEVVPGDAVQPLLLFAAGHDLKLSVVVKETDVRTVCWNTMQAAGAVEDSVANVMKERAAGTFRIPHTGDVGKKIVAARESILAMRANFKAQIDTFRAMADKPFRESQLRDLFRSELEATLRDARKMVARLRKARADADVDRARGFDAMLKELSAKIDDWQPTQQENDVVRAFHEGPGASLAGETAWGAYNAITFSIDHGGKARSSQSRMASSWFGRGAQRRQQVYTKLVGAL